METASRVYTMPSRRRSKMTWLGTPIRQSASGNPQVFIGSDDEHCDSIL
jgi:hypothetical protein